MELGEIVFVFDTSLEWLISARIVRVTQAIPTYLSLASSPQTVIPFGSTVSLEASPSTRRVSGASGSAVAVSASSASSYACRLFL